MQSKCIPCFIVLSNLLATGLFSTDYTVNLGSDSSVSAGGSGSSTSGDFRYVLNQILNNQAQGISASPHTITFTVPEVTLGALPPPINLLGTDTITIGNSSGSPTTINGAGLYRPFFIRQGTVTLQNLNIEGGLAQGGNGGTSQGGGGMGAAGAVFVDAANVTIVNTTFTSNSASAGIGAVFLDSNSAGGGGGLGGNGGVGNASSGGGGGYSGNGGSSFGGGGGVADGGDGNITALSYGGGGGAIIGAVGGVGAPDGSSPGGNGQTVAGYVFGGGGGSGSSTISQTAGGNGGGTMPGIGNADGLGGGGGLNATDATGGIGGGGGAGFMISGGQGGDGGGGGGSFQGGQGGYGGGGGGFFANGNFGGGGSGVANFAGMGGFGGGGGSGASGLNGGDGGFGGGGGGDGGGGFPGSGGVGASNGGLSTVGGDGAALGGALFVNTGTLLFQGNVSTSSSTVSANGGMGAAVGSDLFAVSGASLTFAPGSSDTITLTGTIADDSPASISSTSTWNPGTGSGAALTMQGPGKLVLNGVNTYAGLTTVSGGTLFINGQILGGISVSSGATLSGTGTIYGGGTINGTLSPGSSSSVITFETSAGNLTLGGSSVTNIEIASMNRSHIEITGSGSAALGGTVHVTQNAGSYGSSGEYQILNGSYTGEFNPTVTGGLPGYEFSLSYMAPYIYLLYECPGCSFSIPTTGLSGNALTIANYLNNYASSSTLSLLNTLSGDELQSALNSVSPSRNAFGAYITQQTAFSLSILLTTRMDALRSMKGKSAENPLMAQLLADASDCIDQPEEKAQPVLESGKVFGWISGFGEYARQAARDQNPSFHYLSEAVLAGFDYQGVNRGAAGIAIGYAHTHFSEAQNSGHGNINYYCASLYGHGMFGNFYISPAVWGIFDEVQNTRNISFPDFSEQAQANIYIWQFLPHLEVGYDSRRSWGEIIPFSSLDWAVNWQRGYREEGAAPYNALSPSKNSSMLRSETGLKFCEKWTRDWGSFLLREKLSYVFQKPFGTGTVNTAFTGIPTSFTVTAVDQNLNLGNIGIDFAFMSGKEKRTSITIGYEGEFGSNYWSNQLMLILEKSF